MKNKLVNGMAAWRERSEWLYAIICIALAAMQVLLVLVSWILNAALPDMPVRSLLSSEGIRWFFGGFTDNIAGPFLVWIILLSVAFGTFAYGGLMNALCSIRARRHLMSRQRFALWLVFFMSVAYILVIIALTCVPNAILLSSTGRLFPSSFSVSIVPIAAFGIFVFSVAYGMVSGTTSSITGIFRSMTAGLSRILPLIVIYLFAVQLYYSLLFVFRI